MALIAVVLIVILGVGGYFGYEEYRSMSYNDNLKKSDDSWRSAKSAILQTDIETKSYDTNIEHIKAAMNSTDQAINHTQEMIDIAPDNATREFGNIRIQQYRESKKIMELYLRLVEDLQSSGIWSAYATVDTMEKEMDSINANLDSLQLQLIELIESNPDLKSRLNNVLGEGRVNDMSSQPGNATFEKII
jgi:chromosome segregation ATPase